MALNDDTKDNLTENPRSRSEEIDSIIQHNARETLRLIRSPRVGALGKIKFAYWYILYALPTREGLADAFLARDPSTRLFYWRFMNYFRAIPAAEFYPYKKSKILKDIEALREKEYNNQDIIDFGFPEIILTIVENMALNSKELLSYSVRGRPNSPIKLRERRSASPVVKASRKKPVRRRQRKVEIIEDPEEL